MLKSRNSELVVIRLGTNYVTMTWLVRLFVGLLISRYGGSKNSSQFHDIMERLEIKSSERSDFVCNYTTHLIDLCVKVDTYNFFAI